MHRPDISFFLTIDPISVGDVARRAACLPQPTTKKIAHTTCRQPPFPCGMSSKTTMCARCWHTSCSTKPKHGIPTATAESAKANCEGPRIRSAPHRFTFKTAGPPNAQRMTTTPAFGAMPWPDFPAFPLTRFLDSTHEEHTSLASWRLPCQGDWERSHHEPPPEPRVANQLWQQGFLFSGMLLHASPR
jgi:hypothetical protein